MKKKLMILVPVLLLAFGGVYKFVLAKPKAVAKTNVHGEVYVLAKQFLINLDQGKFAQLTVGLVLKEGKKPAGDAKPDKEAPKPPEGFGVMPQEAVVRDVITDELTGLPASRLVNEKTRVKIKETVVAALKKRTDVPVEEVLFTDVTVQ